jgi:hypothetical protein
MSKFTYLIKSNNMDMNLIKKELKELKQADDNSSYVDILYVSHEFYHLSKYYIKSNFKNIIDNEKYKIAQKDNLRNTLNISNNKNYLFLDYRINFLEYYENLNKLKKFKSLFIDNKVWIFKPSAGFSGIMIEIFTNYDDFFHYCYRLRSKYKHKWKNLKLGDKLNLSSNYLWTLQEYLTEPLLLEEKKFHFRVYFVYYYKENKKYGYWIKDLIPIYTAKKKYKNSDYNNKDIHDTHALTTSKESFLDKKTKNVNLDKIYKQLKIILNDLFISFNSKCFPENEYCFEMFGIDFILDKNNNVKLIEVNTKSGFKIYKELENILFVNIYKEIIRPVLFPNKKKEKTILIPIN